MRTDRCCNTSGQKCHAKGSRKETTDVESEMYTVPVIIGDTGLVTKGLKKNLEAKAGKHSTDPLQKASVLGTSHTIRKV